MVSTGDFYEAYQEYTKENKVRFNLDKAAVGKQLKTFCECTRSRKSIAGGRGHCYEFPELEECRKQFEKNIDVVIDWEE